MENTAGRAAAKTWTAMFCALLASVVLSAGVLVFVSLAAERADAMCCACLGGGSCGGGFCADGIADPLACANLCDDAGCTNTVYNSVDICDGGCGVASQLNTATPSESPSRTPSLTPTDTPTRTYTPSITATPSFSPTRSPSITPTLTPTLTPTITLTPTVTSTATHTPTAPKCCQYDDTKSCNTIQSPTPGGPVPTFACISTGMLVDDGLCDGSSGKCVSPSPTRTSIFTRTPTQTPTASWTASETPTKTPTPNIPDMDIDPYKCYRIKDSATGADKFKKLEVQLVDEFGTTSTAVLKPFLLCNPSVESVPPSTPVNTPGPDGSLLRHQDAHMVCYKVRDRDTTDLHAPAAVESHVDFHDKPPPTITIQKIQVMKANMVCMPAAKLLPTPKPPGTPSTPTRTATPTKTP